MNFTKTAPLRAFTLLAMVLALPVFAQEPEAAAEPDLPALNYQTGTIVLPNKVATLNLDSRFRYLDPQETSKLLSAWGNPPDTSTQGAVLPAETDPFSDTGWAVILTYEEDGFINDSEAAELDYDSMLKDMKEGTEAANPERSDAGFGTVHLVGWAERPRYDSTAKKLYWAKELDFEGSGEHTLNYDVRVLGRKGVLSMNAVANMSSLAQIRDDMQPLISVAEFNEGYRYADFNESTDKVAAYGLGALIAGGVAAKAGLFGKLLALLIAGKKFVIFALAGLAALGARLFKKKSSDSAP
jgi:uncharacterized membrane-anchored protein